MDRILKALIGLAFLGYGSAAPGQAVVPGRELLATGFIHLDDIEYLGQGDALLVARPLIGSVGTMAPGAPYVPLVPGTVHGTALVPGGLSFWVADFGPGTLREVDLTTGAVLRTLAGFDHPLEILVVTPELLLVGSLLGTDFWNSPGVVRAVLLDPMPGQPHLVIPLAQGLVGGMDLALTPSGRLFVASLGSPTLDEILIQTGQVVPVAGPLVACTDLICDAEGRIYACTLWTQEIVRFEVDVTPPVRTQITAFVTSTVGPGLEDMAFDAAGQLLVATDTGEIWRVRVRGELVQRGGAFSTLPFWIDLDLPSFPGHDYRLAASLGTSPPIPVPGTSFVLPLAADPLFFYTIFGMDPAFLDFQGVLDGQGRATATVVVPALPPGLILDAYVGGVIHQAGQVLHVPDVLAVRIFS